MQFFSCFEIQVHQIAAFLKKAVLETEFYQ